MCHKHFPLILVSLSSVSLTRFPCTCPFYLFPSTCSLVYYTCSYSSAHGLILITPTRSLALVRQEMKSSTNDASDELQAKRKLVTNVHPGSHLPLDIYLSLLSPLLLSLGLWQIEGEWEIYLHKSGNLETSSRVQ